MTFDHPATLMTYPKERILLGLGHNTSPDLQNHAFSHRWPIHPAVHELVMQDIANFFEEGTDHRPSPEMLAALSDVPRTIFEIVEDRAAPAYHVCQLDCGTGKTTALRFTIATMREKGVMFDRLNTVGMVLCLGRLEQIEDIINELRLAPEDYAVMVGRGERTSDGRLFEELGVGRENLSKAPILFTTHAMVESRLAGARAWAEANEFFYRGRPRKLRVWDEAVFARKGITVDRYALHRVAGAIRRTSPAIEQFMRDMDTAENRSLLIVPDLEGMCSLQTVWGWLNAGTRNALADSIKDLWFMSGKPVLVRKQGERGVLVTYQTRLPEDIKPMLVLDASARVRATYKQQEAVDHDIVWLRHSPKRYDNVVIYFQPGRSGKEALGQEWNQRIEQVAEIIRRHPEKKALVLHHLKDQERGIGDMENAVRLKLAVVGGLQLDTTPYDVKFLSWGRHNAVNGYADRDLIITASVFREPDPVVEARGRAAADRPVGQAYSDEELRELRHGEVLHDLLQGVSRGALRKLEGDQAQHCLVYLMASKKSGIRGELPMLFPGCQVRDGWGLDADVDKKGPEFTPTQVRILQFIRGRFDQGAVSLSYRAIRDALKLHASNFSTAMKDARVHRELDWAGLRVMPAKGPIPAQIVRGCS
jgi:hypothetical protein